MHIPGEKTVSGSLFIAINEKDVTKTKAEIRIGVYEDGEKIETIETSFLGPFK